MTAPFNPQFKAMREKIFSGYGFPECPHCDGIGWTELGNTLQSCLDCNGTGWDLGSPPSYLKPRRTRAAPLRPTKFN